MGIREVEVEVFGDLPYKTDVCFMTNKIAAGPSAITTQATHPGVGVTGEPEGTVHQFHLDVFNRFEAGENTLYENVKKVLPGYSITIQ